jgi:hypothetical protein
MRYRHHTLAVGLALALSIASGATPAAAQGGKDNVTFWNDAGESSSTADVPAPADLESEGYPNTVYLNPNGGRTAADGLLVIVAADGLQIVRDRDWQVYENTLEGGQMNFALYADGGCFEQRDNCSGNTDASLGTLVDTSAWGQRTVTLLQNGPSTWKAQTVESIEWNSRFYTVTATYSYTPPGQYIAVAADVAVSPSYTGTMHLYFGSDMLLDGSDEGPSFVDVVDGHLVVGQQTGTSTGGIAETGRPFDSYFEGYYVCLTSYFSLLNCGNTAEHWAVDQTSPDHWFGPGFGEPYPMPAIVDGRAENELPTEVDAGVAVHWDVTSNREVSASLFFLSTPAGPAVCQLTPDIAVNPQFINLAPGGRAAVTVSMRNLCNDAPLRSSDLLFSLSDGLQVVGGSEGLVNFGQRAAIQGFSLNPAETRSWTFDVEADATLPTAPIFVVELYQGSNVTTRIDGVFLTPAPAAPTPAPVVEQAPAAPAEQAPLPAALPNTAGQQSPAPLGIAALLSATVLAGALLLRRRSV